MSPPRAFIGGQERHLGAWKPSTLRLRGVKPNVDVTALPVTATIAGFPTDYDQGQLGSCGPNSLAELYEHDLHGKYSRLFAYYFTRATENDVDEDGGVTIPDLLSVAHVMGLPLEADWPYDVNAFRAVPPMTSVVNALRARLEQWDVVVDLDHLLFEIANQQPVMFGFNVPASMQGDECARTGMVRVPSATDPVIGGHCVNAIGYDRARMLVKATCHYGAHFGDGGTIWLPFAMFTTGNAVDLSAVRGIA